MSENISQPILHRASEEKYGQSRPYQQTEAIGLFVLAVLAGLWIGLTVLAIGAGYRIYTVHGFWTAFFILAVPSGVLSGGGLVLAKGIREQLDGLRSYETREAESYAPPMPQLEASQPGPPIVVKPYGGDPYVLGRGNEPLALPDGRESGLRLNEPTIAAILKEVIARHDGNWSRKRLMSIRVQGKRITRSFYEDLTAKLAHAGFLQERPVGGYKVPDDIQQYDDLARYFPNLEGGKAGGKAGRQEQGGLLADPPPGRGYNLAERHRLARLTELDHSVRCYLERKGHHD
jgi:hypothetical protein